MKSRIMESILKLQIFSRSLLGVFLILLGSWAQAFQVECFPELEEATGMDQATFLNRRTQGSPDEEALIIRCNLERKCIRTLVDDRAIETPIPNRTEAESKESMRSLFLLKKNADEAVKAALALQANAERIETDVVLECDSACESAPPPPGSPYSACFSEEKQKRVDTIVQQRKDQAARLKDMAKKLMASFDALCAGDKSECAKATAGLANQPTSEELAAFKSLSRGIETRKAFNAQRGDRLLGGKAFVETLESARRSRRESSGPTTVQQSYIQEGYKQYYDSRVAAAALARKPQAASSPAAGGTENKGKTDEKGDKGAEATTTADGAESADTDKDEVKAASTGLGKKATGLLGTAAAIKDQYDARKDEKKARARQQAALDAAAGASGGGNAAQTASLLVGDDDLKGLGRGRQGDGRTGIGNGGGRNPLAAGRSVASVDPAATRNPRAGGGATGTSAPAASARASLGRSGGGGSGGGGGGGSRGGGARAATSGGSSGSDFDRYTKSSGFFAAAKKALGFGPKKKKGPKGDRFRSAKKDGEEGQASGAKASDAATAAVNKHWNKVLRRVEEGPGGPDRNIAGLGGNARGMTSQKGSLFGSVCNRYSAFRKDTGLKIGRSVCPKGQ